MKLHLLDRTSQEHQSFSVSHHKYTHFLKVWHYHPELDLVVIIKSTGTHFIGDSSGNFGQNDVILIGKELPHIWVNDNKYLGESTIKDAEAIVVHFKRDFLGEKFLSAPENKCILDLINNADRGIKFLNLDIKIIKHIKALPTLKPFDRMVLFLKTLHLLAIHKEVKILSSIGYVEKYLKTGNRRLDKMYEFIFNNFKTQLKSRQVAEYICMNNSAFSRFFKRLHRKTFTTYLNEIRVGYACKLLIENNLNITAIGYESGFNNLSNFNRQFKNITKLSPSKYLTLHTNKPNTI